MMQSPFVTPWNYASADLAWQAVGQPLNPHFSCDFIKLRFKRICPGRRGQAKRLIQPRQVQAGIFRPLRSRWKLLGSQKRDRLDRKLDPPRAQTIDDPDRKAVPAGLARGGNVHEAVSPGEALSKIGAACCEDAGDGIGNKPRRGWRADLIGDDLQL